MARQAKKPKNSTHLQFIRAYLLLPVQYANYCQDEHTNPNQGNGCEQHNITWGQVQFGAPAVGKRGTQESISTFVYRPGNIFCRNCAKQNDEKGTILYLLDIAITVCKIVTLFAVFNMTSYVWRCTWQSSFPQSLSREY